jgi:hypothetical protein
MPQFRFDRDKLLADFRREFREYHGPLDLERGALLNANFLKLVDCVEQDPLWLNLAQIAYVFATAYHETGHDFEPKDEYGKGRGKAYGVGVPVTGTGSKATLVNVYYGRGLVQITWLQNYVRASMLCGVDLVSRPELVKRWPHCYAIMADGMRRGWFTGMSLGDYVNHTQKDFYEARRVVNGLDKAAAIAEYARKFDEVLAANVAR